MFSPQQRKLKIFALLFGVIFVVGMTQLFLLRFEAGNIYPPYSSLRSDPLGTRALFDSLNQLSADTAVHNFRPLKQVKLEPQKTLMMVGLGRQSHILAKHRIEHLLEHLAASGGRLVMTFSSVAGYKDDDEEDAGESADKKNEDVDGDIGSESTAEEDEDDDRFADDVRGALYGLNTLGIQIHTMDDDPQNGFAVRFADGPDILPAEIPWRSHLYFEPSENSWESIYRRQGQPVVVQRPWGKGMVVLVADSYLLSNEALRNHRSSGMLAWLMVPGHGVIFDEFNKGLVRQPGIAGLARQYRLHWVFAALLVVAGLFVWHQAAIFVPSVQSEQRPADIPPAVGRDTNQGLVHLSRQHISHRALLTVCFETWKSQAAQRVSPSRLNEVSELVDQAGIEPRKEFQVETYKQICELLKQGKRS